jgi:hypothetical protein
MSNELTNGFKFPLRTRKALLRALIKNDSSKDHSTIL